MHYPYLLIRLVPPSIHPFTFICSPCLVCSSYFVPKYMISRVLNLEIKLELWKVLKHPVVPVAFFFMSIFPVLFLTFSPAVVEHLTSLALLQFPFFCTAQCTMILKMGVCPTSTAVYQNTLGERWREACQPIHSNSMESWPTNLMIIYRGYKIL